MVYFVYILYNLGINKFYTGYTNDLKNKLRQHRQSKLVHRNKDYKLIYFEGFTDKKDALEREHYLKSTKGRRTLRLILQNTLRKSA